MKLTDAEKAVIEPLIRELADTYRFDDRNDPIRWDEARPEALVGGLVRAYLAGKRAGREDMRERAARVAETADAFVGEWKVLARVGAAIRALGVDDD